MIRKTPDTNVLGVLHYIDVIMLMSVVAIRVRYALQ